MARARELSFADKPVLSGDLVLLRPVAADDAAGLFGVDEETRRLTGSPRRADDPDWTLENLRQWYGSRAGHADRLDLSVIERATGEWAGEVVLNELNVKNESCGFRILLQGPRFYGRGLGTEATRLVTDYAFGVVGLHRIELQVYDFNPRARHVYEKVGFVHEGTLRDALRWDGQWIDCHVMGMLASDWERAGRLSCQRAWVSVRKYLAAHRAQVAWTKWDKTSGRCCNLCPMSPGAEPTG